MSVEVLRRDQLPGRAAPGDLTTAEPLHKVRAQLTVCAGNAQTVRGIISLCICAFR
jgi:hypothetical protein